MHKFLLYLLLVSSYAFSQIITFENALNDTLRNDNQIKSQKINIRTSQIDIDKVKSLSYGKINLSHEMTRTNHAGHIFNSKLSSRNASFRDFGFTQMNQGLDTKPEDLNNPNSINNFTTKITYDIPLFTGFKLSTQEDLLKLNLKAQNIKLNMDEKSLEYEVLSTYNAAVVAKEFIKATTKEKEAISFFVKSSNEFHKEGLVTKIDTKQARVQELNVQSKIIEANNKFDLALAYLIFLTSNENIKDVKGLKLFENQTKNLKELYEYAIQNRDDLKMLNQNNFSLQKNIKLKKASYFPTIYSHLEYGLNDNTLNLDLDKDYYLATLGIKYTLFDNSRKYNIEKSKLEFNKSNLNLTQLKSAIKLQVKKSFLNLNAKQKVFKEKQEAKNLAYEVLTQSKLMYKNQLISMTELLKQEALFRQNEASLIMAKYEKSLAQAKLNLTIGKSLKERKGN